MVLVFSGGAVSADEQEAWKAPPALADWNAYAHFAPNDLAVWIMAAETYLDVGEMKFAEQCIAIALSIDPEHADVRQLERELNERQSTW